MSTIMIIAATVLLFPAILAVFWMVFGSLLCLCTAFWLGAAARLVIWCGGRPARLQRAVVFLINEANL